MTTDSAVRLLKRVALSPDFAQMNRSTIKGFLGELLVKQMLEEEGVAVTHLGNQTGIDLSFQGRDGLVKLDVKLSMPKDEFRWGFQHWSWALQHENKKKPVSATHFVCVGCSEAYEVESVFVIPASIIQRFPGGYGQFTKVKHGFLFPRKHLPEANLPDERILRCSLKLFADGAARRLRKGQKLSNACA